jgi:acetyltransferase-like isoleucine patch superfamily enzyme
MSKENMSETQLGGIGITSSNFKRLGKEVTIYPLAKIVNEQNVEIGDHSKIDDFVFINGGKGTRIGRYVHIASFVSIIGGGELEIGDYGAVACGARIITGTNTYKGGKRMSASLPPSQQGLEIGKVVIGKDAFIGTNVVVHPNVVIGEGAVIGSNGLVVHDVVPWSINVGSPCKKVGVREKVKLPDI